jgi:hypothetical protein
MREKSTRKNRGWVSWMLIVLASLLAIVTSLSVWVKRQVLDTDQWVKTSNSLLADPEVRSALSNYLVDELYAAVDVPAELRSLLPENLQGLAGPVSAALRDPAAQAVDRLLSTEQVRAIWEQVNRSAHTVLVRTLRDENRGAISATAGVITLELREVVVMLGEELGLPGQVLDRLPEDAGRITIVESSSLGVAQNGVQLIDLLSVLLFAVVVALYAIAVYLARNRRRERLVSVGFALAMSGLVVLVAQRLAVRAAVSSLAELEQNRVAMEDIFGIVLGLLRELAWMGITYGLLVAAYGVMIGPSRAAVAVRRWLAPFLTARPAVVWGTSATVVLLVLYLLPTTVAKSWLTSLILVGLVAAAVELLRRQVSREFPDESFSERWVELRARVSASRRRRSEAEAAELEGVLVVGELQDLQRLRVEGALTDEEFASAKRSVLERARSR